MQLRDEGAKQKKKETDGSGLFIETRHIYVQGVVTLEKKTPRTTRLVSPKGEAKDANRLRQKVSCFPLCEWMTP